MVKLIAAGLAALVLIAIASSGFYTVDVGNVAVITRNGAVVGEAGPGLHFKVPVIDSAHELTVKTQKLVMGDTESPLLAYSKDIQQAGIRISINYRLDPTKAVEVFSTIGQNYDDKILYPQVYSKVKEVFGQFAASDIVFQREKVAQENVPDIRAAVAERGVIITNFQIEYIDFTDA